MPRRDALCADSVVMRCCARYKRVLFEETGARYADLSWNRTADAVPLAERKPTGKHEQQDCDI